MILSKKYKLYMISFELIGATPKSFNVIKGDGSNCEPWHLDMLEDYVAAQRRRLSDRDASDIV